MAFFDKLNAFAQNITDKTNDAIETGKLNSKITSEKNLAGEELKKIGTYYYEKFANGEEVDPAILEFCNAAQAHYVAAGEAQAEIDKIKQENEAQKAAAQAAAAAEQAAAEQAAAQAAAMEPAPEAAPAGNFCPNCGAALVPGLKFCGECGTKVEAPQPPAPKVCPTCGVELAPGLKFCGECGTRVE